MATFIGPIATAADVGPVTIDGAKTTSCGVGCYLGKTRPARIVVVRHGGRTLRFDLGLRQPAAALLARIERTYRRARSLEYTQRTDSGLGPTVVAHWTEIAPNSFAYRIVHGAQAIVIGNRRWDRDPGKPWKASKTPESNAITPPWGNGHPLANAHILQRTPRRVVLSFLGADRSYPAWFTATIDPRTSRIQSIDMNAPSHFMHSTYSAWNQPTAPHLGFYDRRCQAGQTHPR
jgi:hypothetical protein